jgi:uncharacterized repeat protein (TIGR03803 family)
MSTVFSGNLNVSGGLTASNGASATFTGLFGVTLTANLDANGSGSATESVSGSVSYTYTYPDRRQKTGSIPFNFTEPNLPFQLGSFSGTEQLPTTLLGANYGVSISGTVSSDLHTISENITISVGGSYQGISFSATMTAVGTLTAPYAPTITGTAANQITVDTAGIKPFQNVVVGIPNSSGGSIVAQVRISSQANGTLTNLAGGTYSNGIYTINGTAGQVSAALNGLIFQPTLHQSAPGQVVATSFTLHLAGPGGTFTDDTTTSVITTETKPLPIVQVAQGADWDSRVWNYGKAVFDPEGNVITAGTLNMGGSGQILELPKNGAGFDTVFKTLIGTGDDPLPFVAIDSAGNLFGEVWNAQYKVGEVFQIQKNGGTYSNTKTTLVALDGTAGTPQDPSGLIVDADGNLIGTSKSGGANNKGTIFKIAKTPGGYASTATVLVSFDNSTGSSPLSVVADAAGNLFGVTQSGGANGFGVVFEIVKSGGTYASSPVVLANLTAASGFPTGSLAIDAAGNLFGYGQALNYPYSLGTLFQIAKSSNGYASTPTVLYAKMDSLGSADTPLIDAVGNVFGAIGSMFKIVKTTSGYSTPVILDSLNASPSLADAAGNLYATGYQFRKISGTGFRVSAAFDAVDFNANTYSDILLQNSSGQVTVWTMRGTNVQSSANLPSAGNSWKAAVIGDFNGDGASDILYQNINGQLLIQFMSGTTVLAGSGMLPDSIDSSWHAVATGDFNRDNKSDILFQDDSGQVSIWFMDGMTRIPGSGNVGINPGSDWKIVGTGDFDGDARSDVLLQNANGQAAVWFMNGSTIGPGSGNAGINPGASWKIAGIADFNDDGISDVILQHTNGQAAIWFMNGTTVLAGSGNIPINPGSDWKIVKTGDYNGDSVGDVLLQNANGQAAIWFMNGTTVLAGSGNAGANLGGAWKIGSNVGSGTANVSAQASNVLLRNNDGQVAKWVMNGTTVQSGSGNVGVNPGSDWRIAGTADFNGDGQSDVLLQNASGQAAMWFLNGLTIQAGSGNAGINPGSDWKIVGTGDFNGDNKGDVLLQNTNGQAAIWFMNGSAVQAGSGNVGVNPGSDWKIMGTGDFNADGRSDVLLQNANGQVAMWLMNGTTVQPGSGNVFINPGSDWKVVGTADLNGDRASDIILQNTNGQVATWLMNAASVLPGSGNVGINPGADWKVVGTGDFNTDSKSDILLQNTNGQVAMWLMNGTGLLSGSGNAGINPGSAWHVVATTNA